MEMLAIYFAIPDNISIFQSRMRKRRTIRGGKKLRKLIINIRSDSKSTVEQLNGICEIRDKMLFRIYVPILADIFLGKITKWKDPKYTIEISGLFLSALTVLTSPIKHSQQTVDLMAKQFKAPKKMQLVQQLSPEGSKSGIYRMLSSFKVGTSILVVGHNSSLANGNRYVADGGNGRIDIKKGGLTKFRVTSVTPKIIGELRWLLTPKLFKLLSKV